MCYSWRTCYSAVETHSAASRKRFATRCVLTLQTLSPSFCTSVSTNLHERALQAVRSVSTPGKDEPETKQIIADVLRRFLPLENAALTGSEQVFVFGVAGKSYAYNHIANALRETWGNDERLRSHDSALSQQLQSGHLAGGVHWSADDNEWTDTCYDCEESFDLWSSEWCDTDGYDDEYFPKETITRPATTTTMTMPSLNTIPHFWINLLNTRRRHEQTRDCAGSVGCGKCNSRHEQTNLNSSSAAYERCAQITWLFSCLEGQFDGR